MQGVPVLPTGAIRRSANAATVVLVVTWMLLMAGTASVTTAIDAHVGGPLGSAVVQLTAMPVQPDASHIRSPNWAGYAWVPSLGSEWYLEGIGAAWFVPTATCKGTPSGGAYALQWVGIDGVSGVSDTVEQIGTRVFCANALATPVYSAWYEFYPYEPEMTIWNFAVVPGEEILASVTYDCAWSEGYDCSSQYNSYYMMITSLTGEGPIEWVDGSQNVCNSNGCEGGPDLTAEWISEAPTLGGPEGHIGALADYGTVKVAWVTAEICKFNPTAHQDPCPGGGLGTRSPLYKYTQVNAKNKVLQSTGGFTGRLSGFKVTWKGFD